MSHPWNFSLSVALLALICSGCATEKAPPEVHWISPQSSVNVQEGDAVQLKFSVVDPAPERGKTGAAFWRIAIGTESGSTWWTTSGTLSAPSGTATFTDTIETTWHAPTLPPGTASPAALSLSALCTDGEGQTGADFGTLTFTSPPLSASGLWWTDMQGFGYTDPQVSLQTSHFSGPDDQQHLVHLDGQAFLVTGNTAAQGWRLIDGAPSTEPEWTTTPSATTTGSIRHIRRAPFEHTGAAWAEIGWSDRCTWVDANGLTTRSWLLHTDETLIDSGVISGVMVLLARTSANDLRAIRFNLNNTARMESVTWTPQASGSTGPEGKAWLLQKEGLPATLETDGTLRLWDPNGGATPISTLNLAGVGNVSRAGRLEGGHSWADRETGCFYSDDLALIGTWPGAIHHVTSDRANSLLWLLSGDVLERQWWALDAAYEPLGSSIPAGTEAFSGSIAHNRPGPS